MVWIFKSLALLSLSLVTLSCGQTGGVAPGDLISGNDASSPCTTCRIFVTATAKAGDFGGSAAADIFCTADANHPGDGTFKALVAQTGVRDFGTLTDWPIKASTNYTKLDGTPFITSEASRDFIGGFPGTLLSSGGEHAWTGLSGGMTTSANCADWTVTDIFLLAEYGEPGSNMFPYTWYSSQGESCDFINSFICVEQ
jgi:hypothetical protein